MAKNGVTKSQARALRWAINAVEEVFIEYGLKAVKPEAIDWWRGFGSVATTHKGKRKYIPVKFHIHDNPDLLWVVNVEMRLVCEAGETPHWTMHKCLIYLPKSEVRPGAAWIKYESTLVTDNPVTSLTLSKTPEQDLYQAVYGKPFTASDSEE
jgi:hypothetical protein